MKKILLTLSLLLIACSTAPSFSTEKNKEVWYGLNTEAGIMRQGKVMKCESEEFNNMLCTKTTSWQEIMVEIEKCKKETEQCKH